MKKPILKCPLCKRNLSNTGYHDYVCDNSDCDGQFIIWVTQEEYLNGRINND